VCTHVVFLSTFIKDVNIIKTKFLIIAPTGAGKDTIANTISTRFNLKVLLSYTTRKQRFPDEATHIFLSDEEANSILSTQTIIAYTEINGNRYFSTLSQLLQSDIYIVDPKGVSYLKSNQNLMPNTEKDCIYIKTNKDVRKDRILNHRKDNETEFNNRVNAEAEQFNSFLQSEEFDWVINNNYLNDALTVLSAIISCYNY